MLYFNLRAGGIFLVDMEKIEQAIKEKHLFVDAPQFYAHTFAYAAHQRKLLHARDGDNFKRVCMEEYHEISKRLERTKFQEGCAVRNVLRTRRLANLLINDKGELNQAVLPRLINHLKNSLYSLGPDRQYDAKRQEHLLKVVILLNENKELVRLLKSIDKPISHKYAEQIIRDTLSLPANVSVTDAHARRAVLSAWMCTLRQSVGSCFATAPAIIIHDEQPEMFLKDVRDLLNTGRLKRTFGGVEYFVPLSASWGAGDLRKPFFVPMGEGFEKSELWLSPGLAAAFETIDLLDPEDSAPEKLGKIKAILSDLFHSLEHHQPFILISAEEIIRQILLKKLGLTEKDLKDYEERPRGMVHSGLLMQAPISGKAGKSKGDLCMAFYAQLKAAGNALKGLSDNALLKAWEFSIASLSETKSQFTRWNLYASLGLGQNEKGGIGASFYEILQRKLDQANQRVKDFQYEYEQVYNQLKTLEARMRSVSSEKEAQWVRVEYQSKRNEFYTLEDIRDGINQKAQRLANLYQVIIDQYDELFPRYFQEVYDADMHDVSTGPYDDSPAGFRLLYKHGRSNTAQWSYIKTPGEFIEALVSFFTATEIEIAASPELEGLQTDLSEIITAVVNHVRTQEFLETAFYRMAAAHHTRPIQDPLQNLGQIDKKPWAYTSGGTMDTLVSCYYRLEYKPTEVSRWMENPMELFVFLCDTMKHIPHKLMQGYLEDPHKSMLMHSPTHAFLLKPGLSPFKEAWQNEALTYIWVRDNLVLPMKDFVDTLWLDEEMMHFLVEHLAKTVPENHRHYFLKVFGSIYGNMRPHEFREHILNGIQREIGLRNLGGAAFVDEIDGMLYTMLPLFSRSKLRERVENIFARLPSLSMEKRRDLLNIFDMASQPGRQRPIVDAAALQSICKGLLCLGLEESSSPIDYHASISRAAQQLGYAMPAPIIFADTNWVKEEFGFVLNPGSNQFELWRIDATGREGSPMSAWEQWLNGSRQDRHVGNLHQALRIQYLTHIRFRYSFLRLAALPSNHPLEIRGRPADVQSQCRPDPDLLILMYL